MSHLRANCATPWPIVKGLSGADLTGLGANVPRVTHCRPTAYRALSTGPRTGQCLAWWKRRPGTSKRCSTWAKWPKWNARERPAQRFGGQPLPIFGSGAAVHLGHLFTPSQPGKEGRNGQTDLTPAWGGMVGWTVDSGFIPFITPPHLRMADRPGCEATWFLRWRRAPLRSASATKHTQPYSSSEPAQAPKHARNPTPTAFLRIGVGHLRAVGVPTSAPGCA
jgi:hypothetical protein